MKRNMDLVREILLDIEEKDTGRGYGQIPKLKDYAPEQVKYHCQIMADSSLIEARFSKHGYTVSKMTWEGHDFLSLSSNNKVWEKTKKTLLDKGIDFTIDIGVKLLTKYTNELLGG